MADLRSPPPDEEKPWTIKGFPAEARRVASEAADREGVGQAAWVARAILRYAGRSDPEPIADEAVRLSQAVAALAAAGVPVQKRVGAAANRALHIALSAIAPPRPPGRPSGRPGEDRLPAPAAPAAPTSPPPVRPAPPASRATPAPLPPFG